MQQFFVRSILGKYFICRSIAFSQARFSHESSEVHKPIKKILVANRGTFFFTNETFFFFFL